MAAGGPGGKTLALGGMRFAAALLGLVLAACGPVRRAGEWHPAPAPGHRAALRSRRRRGTRRPGRPGPGDARGSALPRLSPPSLPRLAARAGRLQRWRRTHRPRARATAARDVLGALGERAPAAEEPGLRAAVPCPGPSRRARPGVRAAAGDRSA